MFLIRNHLNSPVYITGVEEIAEEYCNRNNAQGFGNGLEYHYITVPALGGVDKDCTGLSGLIEAMPACELEVAGAETITPGQKQLILLQLGFQPRGKGQWWHRTLGADEWNNRFTFNLADGLISDVIDVFFSKGYQKHKRQVIQVLTEVTETASV